ncbi:MAG: hypothetical protein PHP82_04060 [Candidatus ainarchaeum sp.]|nr:hypothetical protein [Candidatus ainarchaeum sp.]
MFLYEKAQVNSPFELLVAIIIMGFVIIIGSQMIASANSQVCLTGAERAMSEFKLNLEDTATFRTSNKFDFKPVTNNCYNENKSIMRIEIVKGNSKKCGAICDRAVDSCFIMIFQTPDLSGGYKEKCLNLPVYTSFVSSGVDCPTTGGSLQGYNAIDPTSAEIILSGTYVLRNVAAAGKTYPEICTYWKR